MTESGKSSAKGSIQSFYLVIVLPRERPAFDMKPHESTGYSLTATLSYLSRHSPFFPILLPQITVRLVFHSVLADRWPLHLFSDIQRHFEISNVDNELANLRVDSSLGGFIHWSTIRLFVICKYNKIR